jgi:hypothetical protein
MDYLLPPEFNNLFNGWSSLWVPDNGFSHFRYKDEKRICIPGLRQNIIARHADSCKHEECRTFRPGRDIRGSDQAAGSSAAAAGAQ